MRVYQQSATNYLLLLGFLIPSNVLSFLLDSRVDLLPGIVPQRQAQSWHALITIGWVTAVDQVRETEALL